MPEGSDLLAGVRFGRFRLLPHRRELLADGEPVKLGGRAFDVLMTLIEAREAVVSKDTLMARVWPGRVVEENNLQSHIAALRAALGPDRGLIRTVSGRGYQFIGEIRALSEGGGERGSLGPKVTELAALPRTNIPEPVSELIGRDDELAQVVDLMGAHRLVTLTGTGGIGKTRLAVAAARELRPHFPDGVWLAQFSPLTDPNLVPAAVAAAIGLELGGEASVQSVAQGLAGRRLLLVLDTCEHVIEVAASMSEAALGAGSELRILATSRELLKAEGEWVYPVSPLAVPTADDEQTDLFEYGAIQLFLDRARAANPRLTPERPLVESIAMICRCLDGIPLAIELAAARAAPLGVDGLAARLKDRFRLLTGGKRTALPRHQTLRATLDWSYELLTEPERVLLRRLAVFAGPFSLEAATAVAVDPETELTPVVESLAGLVMKSLVTTEGDGAIARYRLLDTTRAYAAEKLDQSGERAPFARRHAEYYQVLFDRADDEASSQPRNEWLTNYASDIDNLRVALDWAFSSEGDAQLGTALAVAAMPVWRAMSLLSECRRWAETALGRLGPLSRATKAEMILQYALGYSLFFQDGANDRARSALQRTAELAEQLGDLDYQLGALVRLANICTRLQDYRGALAIARKAEEASKTSSGTGILAVADGIMGVSLHWLGEYEQALAYAQRSYVQTAAPTVRHGPVVRLGVDSSVSAGLNLARIHWALGRPDHAAQLAQSALTRAEAAGNPLGLCFALTWCGCLIPLWRGELPVVELATTRLKDHAGKHAFSAYHANAVCFEGVLAAKRGELRSAEVALRAGLRNLQRGGWQAFYIVFLTGLAEVLLASDELEESLMLADEAERINAPWWMPEALRIKGEILRSQESSTNLAVECFWQSLDLARHQGALSWQLRTATSLAGLLCDQGHLPDAIGLLKPIFNRFTEGFDTADLKAAKALLDTLCGAGAAPGAG